MGEEPDLERELASFVDRVDREYPLTHVILFGSQATGEATEGSDVDLILVSEAFEGLNPLRRAARMYDHWEPMRPVDFLCFTPEEFERLQQGVTIVTEALERGRILRAA